MTAPTRPPLRYHGGKWRLAPWIIGHFPAHKTYVEPFGGGASVLLRKPRAALEVLNDLAGDIVTLFRILRDDAEPLIRMIEATPFARAEFDLAQDFSDPPAGDLEACRRLLIRSHMGFSPAGTHARGGAGKTGFRARGVRSGTTPPENWRCFPPVLRDVAARLQGVVIENLPALDLIAMHDAPETLFYVDPPYLAETRGPGQDYAHEMTDADHEALLDALTGLSGRVVLSGYPSALYDARLPGWNTVEKETRAEGALPRVERLWMNFDPGAIGPPDGLFAGGGA